MLSTATLLVAEPVPPTIVVPATRDETRAKEIAAMKWGMFICWSFSTFSEREWTPTHDKDARYFNATGCDTDQWARTAKEAGMGYILFLTKHHDGFCLWDTATTDKKVTNSRLGIDVLAQLRKSCDQYGIKLALYFSEGDWNWPDAVDGASGKGGHQPEMKKKQLKELLTRYGPIEFIWFDHAVGDGGLSHADTDHWVTQWQPNCLPGYNHGEVGGRIRLGECGTAAPIKPPHIAAEFCYPILPRHKGGAMWFYSLPQHDHLCHPAKKLFDDYQSAVRHHNIFSIDVGPDKSGKLRDIDIKTLREVGQMIQSTKTSP